MAHNFSKLDYDRSWTNEIDFPTFQDDETIVRADLQYLFNFIRDYINGNGEEGSGLLEEIAAELAHAVAGTIPDGSITTAKLAADAVIYAAGKLAVARTFRLASSDGTNPGNTVSFDGSGNATLLLPATVKASLIGNASTASKLQTARRIGNANFDGSGNITLAQMGAAAVGASYTKAESDTKLAAKADESSVASRLAAKANSSDVYTKSSVYTKSEVNTSLGNKADLSGGKVAPAQASADIVGISSTRNLTASDMGKFLRVYNNSGNITLTIPSGLPDGSEFEVMRNIAGTVTINTGSGVEMRAPGRTGAATSITIPDQFGTVVLKKYVSSGATEYWVVGGDFA